MKTKYFIIIILLCLLAATNAYCKVKIFYPPAHSLFDKDTITVSGYSEEKISDELKLKIEGTDTFNNKFRETVIKLDDKNLFEVEVHIYPGANKLTLKEEVLYVYYNDGTEDIPYAFSRHYNHSEPGCDNCHVMDPVFSTKITGEVGDICGECHDMVDGKENIHPGFEDSSCIDCHDPHYSKYEGHLKNDMKSLCYDCHETVTEIKDAKFTIVHPPVDLGHCDNCHDPHASNYDFFLHQPKYDLCTSCHPEPRDFGHGSEYDDCSMCHEHHRAEKFVLLKNNYWENCLDCHEGVAEQKFKHAPEGRGCGDCHDPHSDTDVEDVKKGCKNCHRVTDEEYNRFHGGLKLPVSKCFKCHTPHNAYNKRLLSSKLHFPLTQAGNCVACHEMQKGTKKKKIGWIVEKSEVCFKCHGEMKPLVGYDNSIHPPVFNGDCVQCHSPHLKLEKSQLLYPLEEVCYKCHENFSVRAKKFENGSLHLPVEENDCLVCHDPHKSENDSLLLNSLNNLCFDCHDERKSEVEGRILIYYHEPPTEDLCTKCHLAHVSKNKNLLRSEED